MRQIPLFILLAILTLPILGTDKDSQPSQTEDILLIKNIFRKMESATAKKDVTEYMAVFSKRVEIETPDNKKLLYDDIKEYLTELFEMFDSLKDEPTRELEIKITDNIAEVINCYRLSGIPSGEKEVITIDEGILRVTLIKVPSFSPKIPTTYQIIKVSYIVPKDDSQEIVSPEDRKMLLKNIKENYGIDIEFSGGFDLYRSILLQELKAENDAIREETEIRMTILKKRLQKTFSVSTKKEIQESIQELGRSLGQLPTDDEITAVVDNEIIELKEIFLKKD